MHQERFAALQPTTLEHIVPDGEERLRNGGGFDGSEVCRNGQRMALMRQAVFGIAPADDERCDAVALAPALNARAARRHASGDFKTRDVGRALGRRIEALPLHHVRAVDAGGLDRNQDLARSGGRNRPLFGDENVRAARRANAYGGHTGRKGGHRTVLVDAGGFS